MTPLHNDERIGVVLAMLFVVWFGFYIITPARLWFSVDALDVQDAKTWQDVTVDLDREIHRDFKGAWSAKVRRREPQGWVTYATTPRSYLPYQTDSQLPEPVSLQWLLWTEPQAYMLPCGEYEVTVDWLVFPDSLFFRREVSRSDRFIIWGEHECTK